MNLASNHGHQPVSSISRLERQPTVWRRSKDFFGTYYIWIAIPFAILAVELGYIGYRRVCVDCGRWDALYQSLQLFSWESGTASNGVATPGILQIARFMAPAVVMSTAIWALIVLFADQLQAVRAGWRRQHVVICGLGTYGATLAAGFRAAGWDVVMLDSDPDNPRLRSARVYGPALVGDATDSISLRKAGVHRARHLIAVCGNDAVNAKVAAQAMALKPNRKSVLTCHAHLIDSVLWDRLPVRELSSSVEGVARLQFFNTLDVTARAVAQFALSPREPEHDAGLVHLLLMGLGPVTERVILHVGRAWGIAASLPGEHLRITLVDRDASRKLAEIARRYPRLAGVCDFAACDLDIDSTEFEWDGTILARSGPPVTAACVSGDDDARALAAGLAVFHESRHETFPVIVCATQEQGLDLLLSDMDLDASRRRLIVFGMLERGCKPEFVLNGTNEILAHAIHDDYCRNQRDAGQTVQTNPAMVDWDALDEALKDSNREQADNIVKNLSDHQYFIAPLTDWEPAVTQFEEDEIDRMAETEHNRWLAERTRAGWKYTKEEREKKLEEKTSPHLKDWELLSPAIKKIDRDTVQGLPFFLARVGLGVYRRQRSSNSDPHSIA
jgi:voltage-gated potassium channel Kch